MTENVEMTQMKEKLALAVEQEQPYPLPENWCWTRVRYLLEPAAEGRTALPDVDPLYLQRYFESRLFRSQAASKAKDTAGDCLIPLPPALEQQRIVTFVEALYTRLDCIERDLAWLADHREGPWAAVHREYLRQTREIKQQVLDGVFRGELSTSNLANESVEKLLQMIVGCQGKSK